MRKRRRVFRESPAGEYDRTADTPAPLPVGDEAREVILDPEQDDTPMGEDFWQEQLPPHHG